MAGHTLTELIIALSILSIIFLTASLSKSRFTNSKLLTQETKKIADSLKDLSIESQQKYKDFQVFYESQDTKPKLTLEDANGKRRNLFLQENFSLTISPSKLRFYSTGTCSPGLIQIHYNEIFCLIKISLRGRISTAC